MSNSKKNSFKTHFLPWNPHKEKCKTNSNTFLDNPRFSFFFALLIGLLLSGCYATDRAELRNARIPSYNPTNTYALNSETPVTLRRVGLLPIYSSEYEENILNPIDEAFFDELLQGQIFEVIIIPRKDLKDTFGSYQFSSTGFLPHNFMELLRGYYNIDAVMFVDLTTYRPYKPISMGIRAKLINTENSSLIWSLDSIFDSGDPRVAMGAKRFQQHHHSFQYPLNRPSTILQSPRLFSKYVAFTTFRTILTPPEKPQE